ncbi:TPA: hypothetical protein QDB15_004225 [Burkholderia vietnamiensis]|jgi:outer membrane lipoprotein SlyB|uniref:Outer membrane lipoprotein SlyB n=1 Tax=Burkholderia vietnamiensis TaxID=60552 RepID=A0AA44Y3T7_BURVI|nr:hypothetical protein [Burkholderia vietnamiensis]AOK42515.1 hypothetical protein WL96_15255 [Burkholderia vietnamiensis]KVE17608.1 hypothetical protein WI92_04570 [Burkholderia vietnamiensis]KVR89988.1 hypothetical protein WK28_23335 [Burkholderia vietnamiensis]KVS11246.1 hypothetical protein WK29_19060 [Burkholderia vietnamiensis]KVS16136.1 hypothetical protein WK32_27900 [Burkholderia vietnamiensis]
MFKLLVSALAFSCLTACAAVDFGSPDTYQRYDIQQAGTVEPATIVSVRGVTLDGGSGNSGIASLLSAGVSGLLGSSVFGGGNGRYVAGAVAAAGAGFVAQRVSTALQRHPGLEIVVRTVSGRVLVVVQSNEQRFVPGDRVMLVRSNSGLRVTR